jgi:hypothetical protein
MSTAVIGFVGVIAGALTTGGIQFVGEWLRRRNDSVAAARLVYGSLVDAELVIKSMEQYGRAAIVGTAVRPLQGHQAMWEAQRVSLARMLNIVGYQLVQSAFNNLPTHGRCL